MHLRSDQDLIVGDNLGNVLLFLNVGSRFDPSFSVVEDMFAGSIRTYAAPTLGVRGAAVGAAAAPVLVPRLAPRLG